MKHGFLTRDFVIAGLLFSGIIGLMVLAMGGLADNYDNTDLVNEQFSENYDKLQEVAGNVELIRNTTTTGEGLSFRGAFDVAFGSAFTAIQLIFSTLSLFGDMTANVVSDYTFLDSGVIKILMVVLLTIVTTVLVFVWLSSISRSRF